VSIQKKAAVIIGCLIIVLNIALYLLIHTEEKTIVYNLKSVGGTRQTIDATSIYKLYNLFGTTKRSEQKSKNLFNIVNNACPNIAKSLYKLSARYMQQGNHDDAYTAYDLDAHLKPSRISTVFL
jgi:hypothetical protein